jgi:hypothetical protein
MGRRRTRLLLTALALAILPACRGGKVGWPGPDGEVAARHAEVRTVNRGYRRTSSQVLVREIDRPTRANLDWAAYHANFMNADPAPEGEAANEGKLDASKPFAGTIDPDTLTSTITRTPLTAAERARPLALAPLVEWLAARKPPLGEGLEEVVSAVRGETWGLGGSAAQPRQMAVEAFLHEPGGGKPPQVWVKIEVQPWFKGLGELPDEDGDGVAEVYGRVRAELVRAPALAAIRDDYRRKVLAPGEVRAWANQLSSYWYPSYNTDLLTPPQSWPDSETEEAVRKEVGTASFANPAVVMRGKPQGKPTYNVFIVKSGGTAAEEKTTSLGASVALPKTRPTPRPKPVMAAVEGELASRPRASWTGWARALEPFQDTVRAKLKSAPPTVKALPGQGGFLFFRNELEYVVGGDLEKQPRGKNPVPVIVEFKDALAAQGVDFLFVPVPNKVEVFPEKLDGRHKALVGQVVNPFERKLLLTLGAGGVEAVDLVPPFLAARGQETPGRELLYQRQDTHWSHRGLELAARLVADRIKQYPWYPELRKRARRYQLKETSFTRHGDLHSRLAEPLKAQYQPETLLGRQVLNPDGSPYEDDADSPIVVLGDSFTGVYQLTDCQHAGVSAHIAKEIGYPVDLVMSYGGGPNVRQKLLRRGVEDLARKRLVIWMMTARDLYHYWEDWQPLKAQRGR